MYIIKIENVYEWCMFYYSALKMMKLNSNWYWNVWLIYNYYDIESTVAF